jgi:hypothetical protein
MARKKEREEERKEWRRNFMITLPKSSNYDYMSTFGRFMTLLNTFHFHFYSFVSLATHSQKNTNFDVRTIGYTWHDVVILNICSMGFSILVLYGAQLLYENVSKMRRVLQVSGFLLLCFFCLKTISRNQDWHTRETLLK